MEFLGWMGSILLALCALPSTIEAYVTKDSDVPWKLLIPWLLGEIFVIIPVIFSIKELFLIFNYAMNILFVGIICYYKYRANKGTDE